MELEDIKDEIKGKVYDSGTGEWMSIEEHIRTTRPDIKTRASAGSRGGSSRRSSANNVLISLRVPTALKEEIAESADAQGITQTDLIVSAVENSIKLDRALAAVSKCLSDNPPPFVADDWKPSTSECMTFILRAVDAAIKKEEARD